MVLPLRERLSMSSPKTTNLEQAQKFRSMRGGEMSSTGHEPVYHAAHARQAASLSETSARLRGPFWACPVESPKNAGVLALVERDQREQGPLSRWACMLLLCMLKGGPLIASVMQPHGKDDPDPHIGKRSDCHGMAFAFCSLALVILHGPRLALRGLPGKLVQRIAQRFDAAHPSMRLGVHPALKQHRRGSSQSLQEAFILIARAIITDFRKPPRSQTFACTRQARKDLVVFMSQKKGGNLLVILSNLCDQWQQLTHQRQHQARFGARGHDIGLQVGLLQPLDNLGGDDRWVGMLCASEDLLDLFRRSCHRCLWGGRGLQEQQGALLLQFRKQLQGHRVIRYASGRELIDQARLHLDQAILIARKQFQLGNLLAVWREAVQIGQVRPSGLGQQVGINRIGLGTGCGSPTIEGARVDRIDGPACFQQMSNQQPMAGLNDAGHLFFRLRTNDLLQEGVQSAHAFWSVIHTQRTDLTSLLINDQGIMMVVRPVNTSIPHQKRSSLYTWVLSTRALLLWRETARLSHDRLYSGTRPRKCELSQSVEPGGGGRLSSASSTVSSSKYTLAPALCREGLFLVECIRGSACQAEQRIPLGGRVLWCTSILLYGVPDAFVAFLGLRAASSYRCR